MPTPGMKTVADITVTWAPPVDPDGDVAKINVAIDAGEIHLSTDLTPTELIYTTTVDVADTTKTFSGTVTVTTYDAAGNASVAVTATFNYDISAPPPVSDLGVAIAFREIPVIPT